MKKWFPIFAFIPAWFLLAATTYVIYENGTEVGRYEQADGIDKIEIMDEAASNKSPQQTTAITPESASLSGIQPPPVPADSPELSAKQEVWKVSGRVIDLLHLKPTGAKAVVFSSEGITYELPLHGDGSFGGEIPQLKDRSYLMLVPASGYGNRIWMLSGKGFSTIPYEQRLLMGATIPMAATLDRTTYDMQIGLFPDALTHSEKNDYDRILQNPVQKQKLKNRRT